MPDSMALDLLDYSGKIGASGKRPRFRFSQDQKRITSYLPEIDTAMTAMTASGEDTVWLRKKILTRTFEGRTPLTLKIETGMDGMGEVL